MENPSIKHPQASKLTVWWKILITLNIVLDLPFLFYILTGYQWNCKYDQLPDIIIPGLIGFSTLILAWAFIKSIHNSRKLFDLVTTGLFFALFFITVCLSSLGLLSWYFAQAGSWIDASVESPSTQRIATLCVINCGDSCLEPHTLRVGYRALPFFDLYVADLKYEYPSYFVPQIKWTDNNTISVTEAGNTTRIFHVGLINFSWKYFLIFCAYIGIKYGYVITRLQRRSL